MHRFAIAALLLAACSSDAMPPKDRTVLFGTTERPVKLDVPANFDETRTDYPLILVLHGYSASGFAQKAFFQTRTITDAGDAFVLAPDGLVDSMGNAYWNADPGCCDFDHSNVDDVGYLNGLLDAVTTEWPIDPAQVFALGHSNGGYMAYRLACESANKIAAIGVLAGVASSLPCNPTDHVSVLHMHGTMDEAVPFSTAEGSVATWAGKDGCGSTTTAGAPLDLEDQLPGAETTTKTVDGCAAPIGIEEWTIEGGSHIPSFQPTYGRMVFDWLSAHARVP